MILKLLFLSKVCGLIIKNISAFNLSIHFESLKLNKDKGGRENWTVNGTGNQSFIATSSYSLAQTILSCERLIPD